MNTALQQQRLEVEQLRREAAMKRIPVSQAVEEIKVSSKLTQNLTGVVSSMILDVLGSSTVMSWYHQRFSFLQSFQHNFNDKIDLPSLQIKISIKISNIAIGILSLVILISLCRDMPWTTWCRITWLWDLPAKRPILSVKRLGLATSSKS